MLGGWELVLELWLCVKLEGEGKGSKVCNGVEWKEGWYEQ